MMKSLKIAVVVIALFSLQSCSKCTPCKVGDVVVISPGEEAVASLQTGANVPVDGSPVPLLLVVDQDLGTNAKFGPGARLVASAKGSLVDSRVLLRLSTMTFVQDGIKKKVAVDGWVVGPDGLHGVKGRVMNGKDRSRALVQIKPQDGLKIVFSQEVHGGGWSSQKYTE